MNAVLNVVLLLMYPFLGTCPEGQVKIEPPNPYISGPTVTFPSTQTFCVKAGNYNSGIVIGNSFTVDWMNDGGQVPDVSNVVLYSPTSVDLMYFKVVNKTDRTILKWETASEMNVIGFRVWFEKRGVKRLASPDMVFASASSTGEFYRLRTKLRVNVVYWLEVLYVDGSSEWFK